VNDSPVKEPTIIKKYANRRLYNTDKSAYVTLDDLAQMVKEGDEFVVRDAKSGEDLTHQVLTQIILEQEGRGGNLLPVNFLRKLIGYYGHNMGGVLPGYLEASLETFQRNQERLQEQFAHAFGSPMKQFEEITRQNMAMFERAMSAFTPFAGNKDKESDTAAKSGKTKTGDADIDSLKQEIEAMRDRLDRLTK
jgi:polyhydroxyalkanoate synthesis repressor PhaR